MSDLRPELIGEAMPQKGPVFTPETDRTLYEMHHSHVLGVVRGNNITSENKRDPLLLIDRVDAVVEHVGPLRKRIVTSFVGQMAIFYPDSTEFAHDVIDYVTRDVVTLPRK